MNKKTCALYARVSTRDQHPKTQLMALRKYVRRRGFHIFKEYVDHGISGSKESRPSLDVLMEDARRGRFDAVVVSRFDRFARSTRQLIFVAEEFKHAKIDFISLAEAIDTSTPIGNVFYSIVAGFAQFERDLIRERVLLGLDRAREEGKTLGRPRRIVDRQRVMQLHRDHKSLRQIGRAMRVSKDTVLSIIRQEKAKKPGPKK